MRIWLGVSIAFGLLLIGMAGVVALRTFVSESHQISVSYTHLTLPTIYSV